MNKAKERTKEKKKEKKKKKKKPVTVVRVTALHCIA